MFLRKSDFKYQAISLRLNEVSMQQTNGTVQSVSSFGTYLVIKVVGSVVHEQTIDEHHLRFEIVLNKE